MDTLTPTIPDMPRPRKKANRSPRSGSKPVHRSGKPINVWIPEAVSQALDTYIRSQRLKPTQTVVITLALQEFLAKEGFWPPPDATD